MAAEKATEKQTYDWLEVAERYEELLKSGNVTDPALVSNQWELIGHCYELSSRQAQSSEGFRNLSNVAVQAYVKASGFFKGEDVRNLGKSIQCSANADYVLSWTSGTVADKVKALDSCRVKAKKALQTFKECGDNFNYAQTANLLSKCLFDRLYASSTNEEIREISSEAIENSEESIAVASRLKEKEILALANSLASLLYWFIANTSDEEERKTNQNKSVAYAEAAQNLSGETSDKYSKIFSLWAGVLSSLYFTEDIESASRFAVEMLDISTLIRDNYLKGISFYLLAHVKDYQVLGETNPVKRRKDYDDIIRYSEEGIRFLELVAQEAFMADTYLFPVQTYSAIASDYAINFAEKMLYSKRAIEIGQKGLDHAIKSGAPEAMGSALHALSKALQYHSKLETRTEVKTELLKDSLGFRREFIRTTKTAFPTNLWLVGVGLVYAAQIETELSKLEKDPNEKIDELQEALADMSQGVECCKNWVSSRSVPSFVAIVAGFEDSFGGILADGYQLTKETTNLQKANEVYKDALEDFKKVDLPSRMAESYWKIATNLDNMSEYEPAARNFENAFAAYKASAQKITQFKEFFLDYASYMKAWSEIENAKFSHQNENYENAVSHYDEASQLLKQSKSWMYLSLNFASWSILEQAESLSRKEESKESAETFERAIRSFQESRKTLTIKLDSVEKKDEIALVKKLIHVSTVREEYSRGRIAIEEAKILDKRGNHVSSSERYGKAAAIFQRISQMEESIGKETRPLVFLCRAWEKMTLAEAKSSPIMYEEAAELFKLANENMPKESASQMILGHSSFCKALEAGIEFEITRTMSLYDEVVRYLDAAANHYSRAGYEASSDYAKATQRLFSAYIFMEKAKQETDPSKQAKFYGMAEKVLEIAAECFVNANYQNRTEETQRLLKRVREEREMALSLGEIFHAPSVTSSTSGFSSLSPSEETAVGLDRLEQGEIQAKLIQNNTDVKVGDSVTLEIQVMNMGKEPVSLIRIERLIPQGFQITGKPEYCQFENNQLTMRGKRLEPFKTEEIKITLKPFNIGTCTIEPRLICINSVGHQSENTPEPLSFSITAESLPGRLPTGSPDLDNLLLGGIPESYSVVLSSPSIDEKELLIKRFLETGVRNGQTTYFISSDIGYAATLADENPSTFFFFFCNPRADALMQNLPNVFKLKGVENLTDIEIALVKSFRTLDRSATSPKRACITILSDVLLQHHAIITRKWLSNLLADLKSKGFTTLAVINQQMHPPEEFQAILGLFEGEIRLSEKETNIGLEKTVRVKKLHNQKYLENEVGITREKLESPS